MKIKIRYIVLMLLFLPFFEMAFFGIVSDKIGSLYALSLMVAVCCFGFWILKNEGKKLVAALKTGESVVLSGEFAKRGLINAIAALLFAFPGFLSDILGVCILLAGHRTSFNVPDVRGTTYTKPYKGRPEGERVIELEPSEFQEKK